MTDESVGRAAGPQGAIGPKAVRVRVRLFAIQRELAGTREVTLELTGPATVEDAWTALVERFPVLAPGRPAIRFALNATYAAAEEPVADGDEVAMIPPVSGGADEPATGSDQHDATDRIIEITSEPFGPAILTSLTDRLVRPEDGAVVGFLGVTRSSPGTPAPGQEAEAARHADRTVEALEYEALEEMALAVIGSIADEIRERFGVERIAIVHRTGVVPLGEASVAIVACAPHRGVAFDAARYAIDETKARAPIWKAERFADGHVWIGEPAREGPR